MKSDHKILILSRKDGRMTHDTQQSMVTEFTKLTNASARYYGTDLEDLLFDYNGQNLRIIDKANQMELSQYDLIFMIGWFKTKTLEDVASSVARYLKDRRIPFFNSEALNSRVRGKLPQYVIAALNNIPMTPFRFSMNPQVLLASLQEKPFADRFVVKGSAASRGEDNYLVSSADEFAAVLKDLEPEKDVYFVAQQFVPNEGDYRIIVVGDEVRMVIHRKSSTGSHLNNTSKGGKAQIIPLHTLSPKMLEDSVRMARLVKREITGVDMIVHTETDQHYLLEINNMPQLSTGAFVAEKIAMLDEFFAQAISDGVQE